MSIKRKTNLIFCLVILGITICFFSCNKKALSTIQKRTVLIDQTIKKDLPLIPLKSRNISIKSEDQFKAMSSIELKKYFFDSASGEPFLNELMTISKLRPSDVTPDIQQCKGGNCSRWELYNYAHNGTTIIIVDDKNSEVLKHAYYPLMQGEISEELGKLAMKIAVEDIRVIDAYGGIPDTSSVRMQATKTALNRTKCQRSNHLCVAPTFVKGNKALWVIVDLTDLEVVGIKWTEVGKVGMPVTERSAQNDHIMECCCDMLEEVNLMGWNLSYSLTRSDGLKISDIKFNNEPIVRSIKTVDWHVSYSQTEGFGYSDAMGCPEFSQAAVIADQPAHIEFLLEEKDTIGFSIIQNYFSLGWPTPCSYNYRQEFKFFKDGSFRPTVGSLGRGCGNDGTYRPVTRISFYSTENQFCNSKDGELQTWDKESWMHENEVFEYYKDDGLGVVKRKGKDDYLVQANVGQFGDGSRGDNAHIYITAYKQNGEEGESELPTIGPCCNVGYEQGPEKFIDGEDLINNELVMWYVPLLKNDDRRGNEYCWAETYLENGIYKTKVYPCMSGPKFKRIPNKGNL